MYRIAPTVMLVVWLGALSAAMAGPELVVQIGHNDEVRCVRLSADGKTLVSCDTIGNVKVWDAVSGRLTATLRHRSLMLGVSSLALHPNGRLVACSSQAGAFVVFDLGRREAVFVSSEEFTKANLQFTRDGRRLLVGHFSGARMYDTVAWKSVWAYDDSRADCKSAAVRPDGSEVVLSCAETLRFLDGATGSVKQQLRHTRGILGAHPEDVAWSPDGTMVASVEGNPSVANSDAIALLDARTHQVKSTIRSPNVVTNLAFSDDGKQLAAGSITVDKQDVRSSVDFWDVTSGRHLLTLATPGGLTSLQLVGKNLVTASASGDVRLWDTGGRLRVVFRSRSAPHSSIALSPDGTLLAVGSSYGLQLWDLRAGRAGAVIETGSSGPAELAFSRDGRSLAVALNTEVAGVRGGLVRVYNIPDFTERMSFSVASNFVNGLSWSSDGRTIASASDNKIFVWDLSTRAARLIPSKLLQGMSGAALSPDGKLIAARDLYKAEVYDTATGQVVAHIDKLGNRGGICWSPNGRLLLMSGYYNVYWDRTSNRSSRSKTELFMHDPQFIDDHRVIDAGALGEITALDIASDHGSVLTRQGSGAAFSCSALSADRRTLITGGPDATLRFWDVASGRLFGSAVALDRGTAWIATTPDGLFDGTTLGMKVMEWRVGDRLFALDQFFNQYFTPGLLSLIARGAPPAPPKPMSGLQPPPRVHIQTPTNGATLNQPTATVKVLLEDQGGGVSAPGLYLNGHRLAQKSARDLVVQNVASFEVPLVEGTNTLRATAFNKDGTIESRGDEVVVRWAATAQAPVLHVLAVGIDHYQAGMNLNFARADAQAIASFFKPGLFREVKVHTLFDEMATRSAVLNELSALAKEAAPRDAVFVYLSGHGTLLGDMFYFLPHDTRISSDEDLRTSAIAQTELGDALTAIPATKQFLILDACHSGASAGTLGKLLARRDSLGQIRAQQRLSRAAGAFLIAASTAEQYAYEVKELGHGVLTYAILHGLGDKGKPGAEVDRDGHVTANALLRFLSEEVPVLTEKYHHARQDVVQASTGQDFPLVGK